MFEDGILLLNSPLRAKIPTLPHDLLPLAAPGGAQRLYSPQARKKLFIPVLLSAYLN